MSDDIQVGAGNLGGIVGPEDFAIQQSAATDALRKTDIHPLRLATFLSPTNTKDAPLQQADKAPTKTEEIRGPNHERLHELVQLADRTEFRRYL